MVKAIGELMIKAPESTITEVVERAGGSERAIAPPINKLKEPGSLTASDQQRADTAR